ncbi:MAG TPA: Yip1 family protein [Gemmatimonadaceae bacterium]|jgi:hypothetical protein|nr:Yip1 family protein [Gemmatimonadaceae bacterium]
MSEPTMSGAPAAEQETTPPPAAKPASVWEDFIDIFYAPSEVYARRANSGFFLPLVVVTLLTGILFLVNSGVIAPIMDAEMARGLAAAQKKGATMSPEQIEAARKVGETFGKIGAFIFMPIGIFFTGLVLWIAGKIFESKQTLGQGLMVAAYAFMPRVLESVVTAVQGLLLDTTKMNGRFRISLGVGRFLDPDTTSPALLALVGRLDVFTIWVTVLLAIGLSVTGKISRRQAAIAAAIVWVIGALPSVLPALRQ